MRFNLHLYLLVIIFNQSAQTILCLVHYLLSVINKLDCPFVTCLPPETETMWYLLYPIN